MCDDEGRTPRPRDGVRIPVALLYQVTGVVSG